MSEFGFYMPTKILFGWGRLAEAGETARGLGATRVFLVTGRNSARAGGFIDRAGEALSGLDVVVFDKVEENPSIETVDQGAKACRDEGCDLVMGLGGGSPLDAAKAMAMLQANPGSVGSTWTGSGPAAKRGCPLWP